MSKKILFGTHNPAKIQRFQSSLKVKNIELISPVEINLPKLFVEENGKNEKENALIKAKAYFEASQIPSISLDTGFYIIGLKDSEQPGKHVQRMAGADDFDSDEERFIKMTNFYMQIATNQGGTATAYFLDVFAYFDGEKTIFSEAKRSALLTDKIFYKDIHFPIASIYKVPEFDIYYHQMNQEQMSKYIEPSVLAVREIFESI
jgi:inosine/xanthosine triphosphate pyrophosphatase family protein